VISGLLHPDPSQRMGGGVDDPNSVETSNGYGALKGHPFFEGVAWGDLLHTTPPFQPNSQDFPNPAGLSDGADDDWMFGGEATIINTHPRKISIDKEAESVSSKASKENNWKTFLLPKEKQVFTGLTSKRKGLFSKARRLVLTDMPRLFYVDPDSMEMKGEVPWEAKFPVRCTIVDEFKFDVLATKTNRVYHLLDKEVGSQVWVDLINAMVEKQAIEYKMMLGL
jgi:3-phosphoinositide dependent protein kinase-1